MSGALGLGDYGSSDEEEDVVAPVSKANQAVASKTIGEALSEVAQSTTPDNTPPVQVTPAPAPASASAPLGPPSGPSLGPATGPAAMPEGAPDSSLENGSAPPSPYTASRLLIRNLTMPPIPNFDIPPSPPGSPPPATTAKFQRFLELKKKGNHFNERLNQSSALRNPGLLGKLMDFAGISQEDQYASAWPQDMAISTKFPEWAYADKLVAAHEKMAKKKEQERARGQREALDFVPAKQEAARVERRTEGKRNRFDDQRRRSRSPR